MSKPRSIHLSIPLPCSKVWQGMTPTENGKYCTHCQTEVIDFTGWSDAALCEYFSKNNHHICGRFHAHQLNRPINIPPQPHSRLYKIVVGLGLTILVVHAHDSKAQTAPQLPTLSLASDSAARVIHTTALPPNKKIRLTGTVVDKDGYPAENVEIIMELFGKEVILGKTDRNGNFSIRLKSKWYSDESSELSFFHDEKGSQSIPLSSIAANTKLDVVLSEHRYLMGCPRF